jgi:hypothetical protein
MDEEDNLDMGDMIIHRPVNQLIYIKFYSFFENTCLAFLNRVGGRVARFLNI